MLLNGKNEASSHSTAQTLIEETGLLGELYAFVYNPPYCLIYM